MYIYCMILAIKHRGKGGTLEKIRRSVVTRGGWLRREVHRQSTEDF